MPWRLGEVEALEETGLRLEIGTVVLDMSSTGTIFSLSSGSGRAGVAVIRASGPESGTALRRLCGALPEPRRASLRTIRHPVSGEAIDKGLVLWFPGPGTFTGEDMVEFQVHGGRAVIAGALEALGLIEGLRPAEAGEFTRRAFREGRLDLVAVEGLADLIGAETASQRRLAQFHLGGGASAAFERWRSEVVGILARLEAAIDFSDEEDLEKSALFGLDERISRLVEELSAELDQKASERIRDGYRLVIAGPPNVGKSSLLNRIARREAAIVSRLPGTTRDVVEVHLDLDGLAVVAADTAGLREAAVDEIEAEGMSRSRERTRSADMVLWVTSPDVGAIPPPKEIDSETLWISNKSDLGGLDCQAAMRVSAKTGAGLDALLEAISSRVRFTSETEGSGLLARERHRIAVRECRDSLRLALAHGDGPVELVAEDVRRAAEALGRLTGRIEVEALLDEIFSAFCIGK